MDIVETLAAVAAQAHSPIIADRLNTIVVVFGADVELGAPRVKMVVVTVVCSVEDGTSVAFVIEVVL